MSWFGSKILVTFVDEATGEPFATTKMRSRELPEEFSGPTTMHLGGDDWQVVRAEPNSRAKYSKSRTLELRVSRVLEIEAGAILYSSPTICDAIPGLSSEPVDGTEFVLAEDDWRQIELVSATCQAAVNHEFAEIRQVQKLREPGVGWPELRVRSKPRSPLACELTLAELARCLADSSDAQPLAYRANPYRIADGFALSSQGRWAYGVAPGGCVQVLALGPQAGGPMDQVFASALRALAEGFDLELVDWCRCVRAAPSSAAFSRLLAENSV